LFTTLSTVNFSPFERRSFCLLLLSEVAVTCRIRTWSTHFCTYGAGCDYGRLADDVQRPEPCGASARCHRVGPGIVVTCGEGERRHGGFRASGPACVHGTVIASIQGAVAAFNDRQGRPDRFHARTTCRARAAACQREGGAPAGRGTRLLSTDISSSIARMRTYACRRAGTHAREQVLGAPAMPPACLRPQVRRARMRTQSRLTRSTPTRPLLTPWSRQLMPIFVPLCSLRAKLSVASERPLTSRHGVLSPSRTVCEASN
jgi:hypothetical protein